MACAPSRGVWKQLDGLFRFGASGHLGDAELLGRFVAGRRDEAGEDAFAALVERHGPMVLGVCRRVLGDRHEAEDAFQATFLVLARKAGAIVRREQLANWLHGVASRTALDARARADRRRAREQKAFAISTAEAGPDDGPDRGELRAILDEELARLPASYRGAVVLCELDGLSRQMAARRLGIPEGTLSSRLARAKDLLRHRLARRGLVPSAVALDAALTHEAHALILPPSLAGATIQAAARVAAGASLAEAVSASVVTLTQGALHTMLLAKVKGIAFAMAAAAVVTTGVGVLAQSPGPRSAQGPAPQEDRLGAVEMKLDRILEALGSRQDDAEPGPAGMRRTRPAPAGNEPAVAPAEASADAAQPGAAGAMAGMMRQMAGMQSRFPGMRNQMSGMMRGGMSHPIEARVADLERRFNDLERRFAAMERRFTSGESSSDRAPLDPGPAAANGERARPDQPADDATRPRQNGETRQRLRARPDQPADDATRPRQNGETRQRLRARPDQPADDATRPRQNGETRQRLRARPDQPADDATSARPGQPAHDATVSFKVPNTNLERRGFTGY